MRTLTETVGLRGDAHRIINRALRDALPDEAVRRALSRLSLPGRVTLIAVGKAAWSMAAAAREALGDRLARGVVITKYDHARAPLPGLDIFEAGHPVPDGCTRDEALAIAAKYDLKLSDAARGCLAVETPKALDNVENHIIGSVRGLCASAAECAEALGYRPLVLTDRLCCTARDAGSFLASMAQYHAQTRESLAFICGGETVVRLTGAGMGGRNQELAVAAAPGIAGLEQTCVFSVGSDGTDGPTDAAGGYADGGTLARLRAQGISVDAVLADNDAYHALQACGGLIVTGPTGTNVNDLSVLLIRR